MCLCLWGINIWRTAAGKNFKKIFGDFYQLFFQDIVGELVVSGIPEKENARFRRCVASLRRVASPKVLLRSPLRGSPSLVAFAFRRSPSRPSGRAALQSHGRAVLHSPIGVVIASATANAREAPTHPLSCNSFASIFSCVCDSNEQPPGSGRARAALRKCDERSSAVRRICVICVLFSSCPATTPPPTASRKNYKVQSTFVISYRKRGWEKFSIFYLAMMSITILP